MLTDIADLKPQDYQTIRRHAFKFCYQQEINQERTYTQSVLDQFIDHFQVANNHKAFLENLIASVFKNLTKCDELIQKYAKNWKLYRIAKVDLAILRVAITEFLERTTTSTPTIISDALNMAQEYASENSISFLNGILDSVAKEVRTTLSNKTTS